MIKPTDAEMMAWLDRKIFLAERNLRSKNAGKMEKSIRDRLASLTPTNEQETLNGRSTAKCEASLNEFVNSTVSRALAADTSDRLHAENSTLRAAEVTPQVDAASSTKNLKYWRERGGQIEWRLSAQRGIVRAMEKDLAECDKNIKDLKNEALSHP